MRSKSGEDAAGNPAVAVGLAVVVYQPTPETPSFDNLPFYYLAQLDAMYYFEQDSAKASEHTEIAGPAEVVWT